jgi:histidyl-tRNA synthetase
MLTQAPKGTRDVYGDEIRLWHRIEGEIRRLTKAYGFGEIRTPMLEHTELFQRGVGDTTDIVQKEMYTFPDKAGRSLSLRPEQTAGAARAYVERGMHNLPQPTKLYYVGPNFRYENPQAGRYRQHCQFGVEMYGPPGAEGDAEVISLGYALLTRLGITNVTLHLNSIGCTACRGGYQTQLKQYLGERFSELCPLCRQRFDKNPLRILDCKATACKTLLENAPAVTDSLDEACRAHFNALQEMLTALEIPYVLDAKVVRGLDYYTRTVFEFIKDGLTVLGGGRYDGLIEQVGGTPTPGIGFGMGIERLILIMQTQSPAAPPEDGAHLFIGHADAVGFAKAQQLVYALRGEGIHAECDLLNRSVKAQMKYADKIRAK